MNIPKIMVTSWQSKCTTLVVLSYLFLVGVLTSSKIETVQAVSSASNSNTTNIFSGVFIPDKVHSATDFSASWLVAIDGRFMMAREKVNESSNMAGVTFAMVRRSCDNCASVMTRDYFDLFVEHLSSTTNQIPNSDSRVFEEETARLRFTSKLLQAPLFMKQSEDPRQNETIAMVIFCSRAFSIPGRIQVHEDIRLSFFEATFYSVYRYYHHVIVFVPNQHDYDIVKAMRVPAWQILIMQVEPNALGLTTSLPKQATLYLMDEIDRKNPLYTPFKYVYFTEGDQILHMRHQKELYNLIDDSDGGFAIMPHRMNTLPLKQDFSQELQEVFKTFRPVDIPNAVIEIEDLYTARGSCCEDGRFDIAPCGTWWYLCPEWGLRDMTPWLKFGSSGFTMPPATEHQAKCSYSTERRQCPNHVFCRVGQEYPTRQGLGRTLTDPDVCRASLGSTYLGPSRMHTFINGTNDLDVRNLAANELELQRLLKEVARLKKKVRYGRAQARVPTSLSQQK